MTGLPAAPTGTGIGSWPGTSAREAVRQVGDLLGEPALAYLPELPARGPGADLVGRTAALLVEMPVDLQPSGWRLAGGPGRDLARAQAFWREDLDELAEAWDSWSGPLKVSVAGPWTLAATVATGRGEKAVADPGACRDLAASLAEGVHDLLARLARLVPGARWVLQVDEPALPSVLAGRLPSVSGFTRLPAVEGGVAEQGLRTVVDAAGECPVVVHCCAADVPAGLLRAAGASAVALDVALLDAGAWERLAPLLEDGLGLWAGLVPTGTAPGRPDDLAAAVLGPWDRLGLERSALGAVTATPACGLAGAAEVQAREIQRAAVRAGEVLREAAG